MRKRDHNYYGASKWAEMQAAEMQQRGNDRLRELKDADVEWVEWVTAGFEECPHCLAMSGKVMKLSDVKFSEHPECEHKDGCRCIWIAVPAPKTTTHTKS